MAKQQKSTRNPPRGQAGVTLIELLITVVIVGILSAIAYPSYQTYVARANRAEAQGILMENAQFLERNYTTANRYDQDSGGVATALPHATSPKSGTAKYNIAATYATSQSFTLTATPTGSMTGDSCGNLTLDNSGIKLPANCW
jgi:type IV pilus assembly protein PilE